jgi:lycopene cyclase domain-containing protein
LNPKYLYLTIDFLAIVFPFLFSFFSKAPFYKKWKYAWVAILIPAIVFILWDEVFTYLGVWGFNPMYLIGINIGVLPIEELLFFICIPYACLFTYYTIKTQVERDYLFPHQELISSALIVILLIFGIYHIDKWYTGTTFTLLSLALAFLMLKIKPRFMGRFYFAFGFILIPFLIVNGILTGSFIDGEVVWYNDKENIGVRIATIPFEDVFYGMLLLLCNISIFEWYQEHDH